MRLLDGAGAITPPVRALDGLTGEQAATRPHGCPHNIAEVVAHLAFWQDWVLERAGGADNALPASAAAGWPAAGEHDWEAVRERFLVGIERCKALALQPGRLDDDFTWGKSVNALGYALMDTAMHNAHHLGQVITLRQALGAWPPPGGGVSW
ncbi:MAG TPA: DinB family protein [Deinococcales bacterium]|nr:DinB family protein [Deinococcales bacterium]